MGLLKVAPTSLHSLPQSQIFSLNRVFVRGNVCKSAFFWGAHRSSKLCCSRSFGNRMITARLESFSDDEFSRTVQELASRFQLSKDDTHVENLKPFDALEPPDFTERNGVIPANIARKANSFSIPISLRMIKQKKQWQEAGETARCSVKKAFSSMVFIIRELHSYTLQMREILFFEDLQGILVSVQKEMQASFVWLFQKVFSHTPTLMMYLMILLANYSVYSMSNNVTFAATSPVQVSIVHEDYNLSKHNFASSVVRTLKLSSSNGKEDSVGENNGGGGGKYKPIASGTDGDGRFDESNNHHIVTPDDHSEHMKTELLYQTELAQEPNNPLLLANYAQFIYLVAKDFDRAEEYFKRATKAEPKDAEALNKYANFLWMARNDIWAAEETFLEAISAEPGNSFYAANYAHFLWNTGGEDTCFPLSSPDV